LNTMRVPMPTSRPCRAGRGCPPGLRDWRRHAAHRARPARGFEYPARRSGSGTAGARQTPAGSRDGPWNRCRRPPALDRRPRRFGIATPGAAGGGRVAQQPAERAALEMEIMHRAVAEVGEVLLVQRIDTQRHAQVIAPDAHSPPPVLSWSGWRLRLHRGGSSRPRGRRPCRPPA
jgi:hypothetical protein